MQMAFPAIGELIAGGRGGSVYRSACKRYAIKIKHVPSVNMKDEPRFSWLAGALGLAPKVFDSGLTADGCDWILMELLEGEAFRLTPLLAAQLVFKLLCLHLLLGLAHGDIQPCNLLIKGDRLLLIDFGEAAQRTSLGRYIKDWVDVFALLRQSVMGTIAAN